MGTQTTQQLLEKQNEMITELIAITRDCVQACHLALQNRQLNEIKREAEPLLNPQPFTFRRQTYLPTRSAEQMEKAKALFDGGKTRYQIAAELTIPYSTVCQMVRAYVGPHVGVQGRSPDPKPSDWQTKAIELYKNGLHAGEISMQLMVDYHTVYGFLRKHADYKPQKRRVGRITA